MKRRLPEIKDQEKEEVNGGRAPFCFCEYGGFLSTARFA
jgi:hypothetical protein